MKRKLKGLKHRSIQLDLDLYRVRVPIKDVPGASLAVVDLWPEAVEQTIVFVHGYAGCAETWEYQINHFARDYRVVVPDLRGHGQSDAPYTAYTMDEILRDLQTVVERLALPERFVLIGHSFGGSICVEYANAFPERLERLVLIAAAGEYPLPRQLMLVYRIPTVLYRGLWKYRWRWNAELHVMQRMMLNNMRRWRGWPLLRNIRTPTLIIRGERDTYFPQHVYDDVGKLVPGAEIYDVGGAKHKVQIERHEAVNRAIERFIKGRQRSSWRGPTTRTALIEERPWLLNYHPETPYTIPIPRQPLYRFLESAASAVPKRHAIIFYRTLVTYQQLNRQANQFAHALSRLGVRAGERVLIALPNVPQMVVAYYGAMKAGAVVVLPHPDATWHELAEQARETGARVVVTLANYGELVEALAGVGCVEEIILADVRGMLGPQLSNRLMAQWGHPVEPGDGQPIHMMAELMHHAPEYDPDLEIAGGELAVVAYTGATTGRPIGVCLSHTNLVANALQTRHWIPGLNYGRESCLAVVPLAHSYGMTCAMNLPVTLGSTMILLPEFDVEQVLDYVKSYRPTFLPGVPAMYQAISHAPRARAYGLDAVKACLSGGSPLPVEVEEEFEKVTRGRLIEGYGLTEASPLTHAKPLSGARKAGSAGVPISNTRAKIIDPETGAPMGSGEVGELAVQGPQVMLGYWGGDARQDGTCTLCDGWLHTGDMATMDVDGYFQIIGRKQDTIRVGGRPVYPRDVEEVLYENVKVQEAAVVGIPRNGTEQAIKAFVVPRPGMALSAEELRNLCRRRLESYAVPDEIVFRTELPRSSVGKVLRARLTEI